MKTAILILAASSFALAPSWTNTETQPATATAAADLVQTGTISGWSIQSDGTVALRLSVSTNDDGSSHLWFVTPPNRTTTTQVEELILDAVIGCSTSSKTLRVSVEGDVSNNESGDKIADAIPIMSLTWLGD